MHPVRWAVIFFLAAPLLLLLLAGIAALLGHMDSCRSLWRATRILLGAEIILIVVAAAVGASYQSRCVRHERQTLKPPGQLIDVGGYKLHLYCTGWNGPTVVLEHGLDGSYLDWYRVQPDIAKFARVCSYDRAGYGWSDPSPKPRLPSVMAEELHTLLANSGEKPPYILVGHSFGSFDVQMYAHRYPQEITGLVLVDGAHPDELLPFYWKNRIWMRLIQFTMPFGLPRWRGWCGTGPEEVRPIKTALDCHAQVYRTHYAQWKAFPEAANEVRDLGRFSNLSLIVISRDPDRRPDPSDPLFAKREEHWRKLQGRLAELSADSTQIVATGSGHSIPLENPQVIVDAVRNLVTAFRNNPISDSR